MRKKLNHRKAGKETLNPIRRAAYCLTVGIISFAISVGFTIDNGYAHEPNSLEPQQSQQATTSSPHVLFWQGKCKGTEKPILADFVKKKEESASGGTYLYETPYSPIEIQQWKSAGERPLYHYKEFYYTNPDKTSVWQRAVCVRLRSIYDVNEIITNIAFLRSGEIYVYDWNAEVKCYEYRKDLKPRHRELWLRGFDVVFRDATRKEFKAI